MKLGIVLLSLSILGSTNTGFSYESDAASNMRFIQVATQTKTERSLAADQGMTIEFVRSDSVWGFANEASIKEIKAKGLKILANYDPTIGRSGHHSTPTGTLTGTLQQSSHESIFDFPAKDSRYHNYNELITALSSLQSLNANMVKISSIGKTIEGRDIWAIHINTNNNALISGKSNKPGVVFTGAHHAREHLSTEIPLMFAQHLLANKGQAKIQNLLDSRDIWIIPMVNPDGVEWDIEDSAKYKWWRKNRKSNSDGTMGVDLNRNYGFKWGTGGSSNSGSSDTYMGEAPFSEPETQAIKNFIESHDNIKTLISFHTFSELILYPWGHTYDAIGNNRDQAVFKKMATTMAQWNGYTPQQSSDLYIASGDTTDWAYGEHGIFAFTFELTPKSLWDGGFYPGADVIDNTFKVNIQPMLYMLDVADDPYKILNQAPTPFLNTRFPQTSHDVLWTGKPF